LPPLTADDRSFLADPGTWRLGPTFDLIWDVAAPDAEEALLEALRADPSIQPAPHVRGRPGAEWDRLAWAPGPLKPVGLTVPCDGCPPPSVHGYIHPPHLERATGYGRLTPNDTFDRRVKAFLSAAVSLTNRLHAQVPLLRARLFNEGEWIPAKEEGVVLIHHWLVHAMHWPHEPAGPNEELAALPLGVDV
jgi:hypothetical protein